MSFSVDDLRVNSRVQGWLLLLVLCLQLLISAGELSPSRHITSKRSTDLSAEILNSKEVEDLPTDTSGDEHPTELSGEDSKSLLKPHQETSSEIVLGQQQRSAELQNINNNDLINRAIKHVYNSEDTLQQYNAETHLSKYYPTIKPDKQTKIPSRIIVTEMPKKTERGLEQTYRQPLFKYLNNDRNSEEVINKIIGTGTNNTAPGRKSPLKNAYLTKFTSYNITHLRDDKHNESFLLQKNDNSSTDIRYLDSKNRFTNFSDTHISSLKTVLDPEIYNQHSNLLTPSRSKIRDNEGKIDRNMNFATDTEKETDITNGKLIPDYITANQHNIPINQERFWNTPDDFVGGQFVMRQDKSNLQTTVLPQQNYYQNAPNDFTGAQYIGPQNEILEKSSRPKIQNSFVGDQFTDFEGRDNVYGYPTTDIIEDKNNSAFVGAQFIKSVEDLLPNFVGDKFVDDKMENETTDSSFEATDIPDLTYTSEFETSDILPKDNLLQLNEEGKPYLYLHDERKTTDGNYILASKDMYTLDALLQNQLKDFDLYDKGKGSTLYAESNMAPADNKPMNINHNTNQEDRKNLPTAEHDDKQSKFKNDQSTTVNQNKENYDGAYDVISILGISQTKNDSTTEVPIQQAIPIPALKMVQSNNNNYRTVYKKNKIILPYSRSNVPYKAAMASFPRLHNRPISTFPDGSKTYDPKIPDVASNSNGQFTSSPSFKDNVVYKTNDGDTEVIVSVSSSPEDKLKNDLRTSEDNSNSKLQDNNAPEPGDKKSMSPGKLSETEHTIINTENENDSEYDHYFEDDGVLGRSNSNYSQSILEKDPNSKYYVTELVSSYFTNLFSTEPSNTNDIVNSYNENPKRVNPALPVISDVTNDYIVAESSDLLMNNFNSESVTSSSSIFEEKNKHPLTNGQPSLFPKNISEKKSVGEDVELFAGSPFQAKINNDDSENIEHSKGEAISDGSKSKSHLSELCIPLTNEKYISLLDLLSGPFYLDKNGKKIAMSVRGDRKKNCTLSSKQCKLFVDLKDISSSLNPDSSIDLTKDDNVLNSNIKHEKRHITETLPTNEIPNSHPAKYVTSETYINKLESQTNVDKLMSGGQFSNTVTESIPTTQSQFKNIFNSGKFFTTFEDDSLKNQQHLQTLNLPSTVDDVEFTAILNEAATLIPKVNEKWIDLFNQDDRSGHHNHLDTVNSPIGQVADPHKNRPARTIDNGMSSEGEKCGCRENDILKSPSPFPNYKQFVAKRADILKNIVYTVSDWGSTP